MEMEWGPWVGSKAPGEEQAGQGFWVLGQALGHPEEPFQWRMFLGASRYVGPEELCLDRGEA